MPEVEVSLSERTENEIDRVVQEGDFVNREQAIEELLQKGVAVYDVDEEPASEMEEEMFSERIEEQQDPAMRDEGEDDSRTF